MIQMKVPDSFGNSDEEFMLSMLEYVPSDYQAISKSL